VPFALDGASLKTRLSASLGISPQLGHLHDPNTLPVKSVPCADVRRYHLNPQAAPDNSHDIPERGREANAGSASHNGTSVPRNVNDCSGVKPISNSTVVKPIMSLYI
jgi:hypothetical protein